MDRCDPISPSLWGDEMWTGLYAIAFSYPETPRSEHIKAAIEQFSSLKVLLPCGECRDGYSELIKKHRIEHSVRSKTDLCKWVNRIHNEINIKLGKPGISLTKMRMYFNGSIPNPLNSGPDQIRIKRKKCKKCE